MEIIKLRIYRFLLELQNICWNNMLYNPITKICKYYKYNILKWI